jgi:VanZ family protein
MGAPKTHGSTGKRLHTEQSPRLNLPMSRARSLASLWLPVVVWMALIFIASADTESGYRGSRILAPIIRWFVPDIDPLSLQKIVLFARKGVHFVTFGFLAALLFRALSSGSGKACRPATAWTAWGITVLYAISDEVHQSFVPSRVGSPMDVLIDAFGAGFTVVVLLVWCRRRKGA